MRMTTPGHRAAMLTGIALTLVVGFHQWKQGVPYDAPNWSPDNCFYVQKFRTWTYHVAMPGQGSDSADGYVRLFDHDGKLIAERFATFFRDVKPVWAPGKVYLMGVNDMDDHPWLLPNSTGLCVAPSQSRPDRGVAGGPSPRGSTT